MKSLSYLKSCIKKTDNQIPTTLTMVKILHNLKIKKTEENLSKYGIRTLRKVSTLSLKETFIFKYHFPKVS